MSLFAPSLNYIWKVVSDFGIDPLPLFEQAGIDPALRLDVSARVSAQQMDDLVWHAKQLSHDDAFAFKLAAHLHPSYLGALGYAWMTSATLRKAFERLSRHTALVYDELRVLLVDREGEFHVIIESNESGLRDPALRERGKMAIAVQLCRMVYGEQFNPTRIGFRHPVASNAHAYYEFFRCHVDFDAEATELVMPVAVADQELPGFNPQLVHTFDELIIEYLRQRDRSDIVGRTRGAIFEELPSGEVSLEKTAGTLNMSSRSLARKLADQGQSFKALLNEVRRELAEKYIRDRSLTLTEISFLLGFSEASSFSRAYRGWSGSSPRAHRESIFPMARQTED
jgi:AraC-like DNA-binding protein